MLLRTSCGRPHFFCREGSEFHFCLERDHIVTHFPGRRELGLLLALFNVKSYVIRVVLVLGSLI